METFLNIWIGRHRFMKEKGEATCTSSGWEESQAECESDSNCTFQNLGNLSVTGDSHFAQSVSSSFFQLSTDRWAISNFKPAFYFKPFHILYWLTTFLSSSWQGSHFLSVSFHEPLIQYEVTPSSTVHPLLPPWWRHDNNSPFLTTLFATAANFIMKMTLELISLPLE